MGSVGPPRSHPGASIGTRIFSLPSGCSPALLYFFFLDRASPILFLLLCFHLYISSSSLSFISLCLSSPSSSSTSYSCTTTFYSLPISLSLSSSFSPSLFIFFLFLFLNPLLYKESRERSTRLVLGGLGPRHGRKTIP